MNMRAAPFNISFKNIMYREIKFYCVLFYFSHPLQRCKIRVDLKYLSKNASMSEINYARNHDSLLRSPKERMKKKKSVPVGNCTTF